MGVGLGWARACRMSTLSEEVDSSARASAACSRYCVRSGRGHLRSAGRACAKRYLNVRPRGWADTVPICAWLPARAKLAPRAIGGPRAHRCVLWHQANLNPPTEMTVRIREMRRGRCVCVVEGVCSIRSVPYLGAVGGEGEAAGWELLRGAVRISI